MPIAYKVDILAELKACGINASVARKDKLLAESVLQYLHENRPISLRNIGKICDLLECEPGDILVRVDSDGRRADGSPHQIERLYRHDRC